MIKNRKRIEASAIIEIANHYKSILTCLGEDVENDPNLKDTPIRAARSLFEMCQGSYETPDAVEIVMRASFPTDYDEMVAVRNVEAISLCPHHLLPIQYSATVAYIPEKNGKVIGLSKLPRLVQLLAARLILQEDLAVDICATLDSYLHPEGVGVCLIGEHGCMQCRGIKMRSSDTVTTKLLGCFKLQAAKEEFLAYCGF